MSQLSCSKNVNLFGLRFSPLPKCFSKDDQEDVKKLSVASELPCLFALSRLPQGPAGCSPKSQNGLLSPPKEEKLSNSQTSLYEMLQEKGRWGGVSPDHSALLPLRFKNIREKTDAHFVDVIKEDR